MLKKILVSQPKPSSDKSPYYDIAREFGVELVFRPFIKVEGLSAREFRQQKVSILNYTAIVFTSRHAIDHFFTLLLVALATMIDGQFLVVAPNAGQRVVKGRLPLFAFALLGIVLLYG